MFLASFSSHKCPLGGSIRLIHQVGKISSLPRDFISNTNRMKKNELRKGFLQIMDTYQTYFLIKLVKSTPVRTAIIKSVHQYRLVSIQKH